MTAVQHSLLKQNALDGAPRCFMLPRFSLAKPRRRKESAKMDSIRRWTRFLRTGKCW